MPKLNSFLVSMGYWLLWLYVVNRYAKPPLASGNYHEALLWFVGSAAVAAALTWAKFRYDDQDDEVEDAPASPAMRVLVALGLMMTAAGIFVLAEAVPPVRSYLWAASFFILVVAVLSLFFGRSGQEQD